jgi:hypothetical protein
LTKTPRPLSARNDASARRNAPEGIVAKPLSSPYSRRERGWIKVKNRAYWRFGQELELAQSPAALASNHLMILYGVRSPGPGGSIVGDVVDWFSQHTRRPSSS